jgi:hypothetical protein
MATRVVFRLSVSRPVTQTHSIHSSPGGCFHDSDTHTSDGHQRPPITHQADSDTAPRTYRPFSFRLQNEYLLYAGTCHTISLNLCCLALYRTTQAVSSPLSRRVSKRTPISQRTPISRKLFVSTVSLSTPSGVSSSSLWLAGGRGGNRIRRIHGRELQQRVQLGLRGRTLCLSGDAPWWHGGRGPSTAARKHRHRP